MSVSQPSLCDFGKSPKGGVSGSLEIPATARMLSEEEDAKWVQVQYIRPSSDRGSDRESLLLPLRRPGWLAAAGQLRVRHSPHHRPAV